MSPSIALSSQVSTRSTMFRSLMYPLTLALFWPTNVTTLYFLPRIVSGLTVALLAAAARKKPYGVIQISNCCVQGVLALTMIVWFCGCSPTTGCWPPPRGGFSPCMRIRSIREAGVSKLMTRVYVLSINFGQGELGFGACPIAKSIPEPEYSIDFRLSAPIALDALLMTVLASWAAATHDNKVTSTTA